MPLKTSSKMVNNCDGAMISSQRKQHWNKRMDLEDALLVARCGEISSHRRAAYYRRQAERTREIANGVTTRAIRSRLIEEARHFDGLAEKAENPTVL